MSPSVKKGAAALLLCLCSTACAQPANSATQASTHSSKAESARADPLHRETPQSSLHAFLDACRAHDYAQARRYLDLRQLAENQRVQEGTELARQLEQILEHDVRFDIAAISQNPEGDPPYNEPRREPIDSFVLGDQTKGGTKLDLELERVSYKSGLSVWLVSAASVKVIPKIAHLASESRVERILPAPLVNYRLLDTALWRWIALALLAAGLWAASGLVSRMALLVVGRVLERFLKRGATRPNWEAVDAFAGPLRLVLLVAAARAGVEWIAPSARLMPYLNGGLAVLFFYGIGWLGVVVVDLVISGLRNRMVARHHTFSHSVLPLASRLMKVLILLLVLAAVLASWGYNASTILAGLGIGGIALALAAQKTIENLFGGVAVVSDRPVFVGDLCKFGERVGTVEDIGVRSTRIRTHERTLVSVPNGEFSSMILENFSMRDKMLFRLTLNLRRDTSPDQVRILLEAITRVLTGHKKVEAGVLPVRFIGVGTYSLDLEVFAYVQTQDGDEFLQIQQELLLRILDQVEAAGTALAYPTQASINYSTGDVPQPELTAR